MPHHGLAQLAILTLALTLADPNRHQALAQLPIAPAAGGTGNGLHQSICVRAGEASDEIGTAFTLVKGRPSPLDLWEYVRPAPADDALPAEHVTWSVLSFSWGIVSDA